MKKHIRKVLGAVGVAALVVFAAACHMVEHPAARHCYMSGDGSTYCQTRVGLNDQPDDGTTQARFVVGCTSGALRPGAWRTIIGTTSDYGAGTSNPEWNLWSGTCPPGDPVATMAVNFA